MKGNSGSALPIALIMLLVLTVLGVAGLRMAEVELKITGAVQSFTAAFFVAESTIESALENASFSDSMSDTDYFLPVTPAGTTGLATLRYLDRSPVPGGGFSDGYAAYHFEVAARGTRASSSTSVDVVQGIYLIANGNN